MENGLWPPRRAILRPDPPSYVALDLAIGIGAGAKVMDKSRHRAHATMSGATWADGVNGRCIDLDSSVPAYIQVPAAYSHLDFTSEDFSIVWRLVVNDVASQACIYSKGRYAQSGITIFCQLNGSLIFNTSQSGFVQYQEADAGKIEDGIPYTVGLSRSGKTALWYVDGLECTKTHRDLIDPASTAYSLTVGVTYTLSGTPWDGQLEFLRVFKGIALDASAHLAWHNSLK